MKNDNVMYKKFWMVTGVYENHELETIRGEGSGLKGLRDSRGPKAIYRTREAAEESASKLAAKSGGKRCYAVLEATVMFGTPAPIVERWNL